MGTKNKKKILFVTESLACGGMERVLVTIANALDNNGFDVTIICYNSRDDLLQELNSSIHYVYIQRKKFRVLKKFPPLRDYYSYYKASWEHRVSATTLYRYYVGKEKYDVEIGFYRGPAIKIISGSTNHNSKKIAWVHTDFHLCDPQSIICWFNNINEVKAAYGKMDRIVCVSEKVKQSFIETIGYPDKTCSIYNMISAKRIIELSKEKCPILKKKFTIVTVGRLIPDKCHMKLLSATKKLINEGYNFDVWIIGSGRCEDDLINYCVQNELRNVTFTGMQDNPYKYIKEADVFALTSRREGFAIVIPEAMACGLPVLSTECTGPTEVLGGGEYGLLVENSYDGVYNGMKLLLDDSNILKHYRKKSKDRFMDFDVSVVIPKIIDLL